MRICALSDVYGNASPLPPSLLNNVRLRGYFAAADGFQPSGYTAYLQLKTSRRKIRKTAQHKRTGKTAKRASYSAVKNRRTPAFAPQFLPKRLRRPARRPDELSRRFYQNALRPYADFFPFIQSKTAPYVLKPPANQHADLFRPAEAAALKSIVLYHKKARWKYRKNPFQTGCSSPGRKRFLRHMPRFAARTPFQKTGNIRFQPFYSFFASGA